MKIFQGLDDEELTEIVQYINEKCNEGAAVLVEGESDREALTGRGVVGEILTLHELLRRLEFGDGELRVLALLDLDREGERILRWLENKATSYLKLDTTVRTRLRRTERYRRGLRTVHQIFMGP